MSATESMKPMSWKSLMLALPLLLAACKTDLHSKLDEAEANQMMALLIYHHIPADKEARKEGIALRVDDAQFVDAVEVLRQNGLPRAKTVTMQDLFPSGQLVSSPEQEAAKLTYLKAQQLEKMLASMEGVIAASVSVAAPRLRDGLDTPADGNPTSAAIYLKYSPEVNLPAREADIRSLARDAIPDLRPERISVSLQRGEFRYMPQSAAAAPDWKRQPLALTLAGSAVALLLAAGAALAFALRAQRRKESA